MKKILTAALAALTLGGAVAATATPADARGYGWHGGGGYYRGGGYAGPALVAGLAGLAVGAALTSGPHYGYSYGPGPGYYYGGGYAPYATCYGSRRVWDPYYGRWIWERSAYAC